MSDRIFFDTNILVYAFNSSDSEKEKSQKAQELLMKAMSQDSMVLSAQVLGELHVTLTRKGKPPLSQQDSQKITLKLCDTEIVDLTKRTVLSALELQTRHKISYWDALIIVTAQSAKCHQIFSEDLQHGQKFGDLRVINPFR